MNISILPTQHPVTGDVSISTGCGDLISTAIVWPFFLYSSVVTSRS